MDAGLGLPGRGDGLGNVTQPATVRVERSPAPASEENGENMSYDDKVEETRQAIDALFGDTSVSRERTRDAMEELLEYIQTALDALEEEE